MMWYTVVWNVLLIYVCGKAVSVGKQSKSPRGCFAELKCGGEIKEIHWI
jgi:hypothetical protein